MAPKRSAKEEDLIDGDGLEDDEPLAAQSEESESEDAKEEDFIDGDGLEDDYPLAAPSEESEESESEDEETPPKKKSSSQIPTPTITTQKDQSSSESVFESEEGSDYDSDSDKTQRSPSASDFTVMPIPSKPMDDASRPKVPTLKPTAPVLKPSIKRPAETEENGSDLKRKKNKVSNGNVEDGMVEEKKSGASRVWSEDDEIAILQGMQNYRSKKGSEPSADMGAFHAFIKEALRADISKDQLTNKIRRLKKKYQNNEEKGKNGEDPVFSIPHEFKSFELSKKIWGGGTSGGGDSSLEKSNTSQSNKSGGKVVNNSLAKPKEELVNDRDDVNLNAALAPYLSFLKDGRNLVEENLSLIGGVKVKEMVMEEKWKVLMVEELEVYLKKLELIKEQTELLLDAMQSSKSYVSNELTSW